MFADLIFLLIIMNYFSLIKYFFSGIMLIHFQGFFSQILLILNVILITQDRILIFLTLTPYPLIFIRNFYLNYQSMQQIFYYFLLSHYSANPFLFSMLEFMTKTKLTDSLNYLYPFIINLTSSLNPISLLNYSRACF